MRPLIAADPMLRAPSPEMVPASTVAGVAGGGAGMAADEPASGGPATTTRDSGAVGAGIANTLSSTGTLISARSYVKRAFFGPPFGPLSTDIANHTPPTCW